MSDGYASTISPYSHNTLTKEQMKDDLITRLDTVNTANRLVETWNQGCNRFSCKVLEFWLYVSTMACLSILEVFDMPHIL